MKELGTTVKAVHKNCLIPSVSLTNLLFIDPILAGFSCTFDKAAPKYTKTIDLLLGIKPTNNHMVYLRQ